jgi:predicted nucleotidyltransferase
METENKIIKYLIENKREFTIKELAKNIKSDYKITHTAVKRLIKKHIVSFKSIGRSIVIGFNNKLTREVLFVEFVRREDVLKNNSLLVMLNEIKDKVMIKNFTLLLFGSYANKKNSKNSDIDLLFIVHDNHLEKDIEKALSLIPLKIHSFIFSEKQFIEMKNSQELNVVKEAIKNNVILYGIEQYYELLK